MVNVDYSPEIPREVLSTFQPILERHVHRLPAWVHELYVYPALSDSGSLCTSVDYEYRQGRIGICSGWMKANDRVRESDVIHEILHFSLDPLEKLTHEIIEHWLADATTAQKIMREQHRIALESVVTDLTQILGAAIRELPSDFIGGPTFSTRISATADNGATR